MKTIMTAGAAAIAALMLAGCNPPANEAGNDTAKAPTTPELEGPKPGLWRVTTAMDVAGAPNIPPQEICITESKLDTPSSAQQAGAECTSTAYTREGNALISRATCNLPNNMKSESVVRVTGDFNSNYTTEVVTTMDPAPMPELAQTKVVMTAERIGDCPAN